VIGPVERQRFAEEGSLLIPGVVPEDLLAAVDAEVDAVVQFEPVPPGTVGPHFFFWHPQFLPAARAVLDESDVGRLAGELVAPLPIDLAFDHIQVALNIPPYSHRPGAPHLDGHRPELADPDSFTMLATVFLGDETAVDAGNLWVWPGSHLLHQRLFRERGPHVLLPVSGHACLLDPPVVYAPAVPVLARRGDLLLAHFLLGHNSGGNTTDTTRRVLYYRLACDGHRERWAETFVDAFAEYGPVARERSGA
jgi:hypothetical protein